MNFKRKRTLVTEFSSESSNFKTNYTTKLNKKNERVGIFLKNILLSLVRFGKSIYRRTTN